MTEGIGKENNTSNSDNRFKATVMIRLKVKDRGRAGVSTEIMEGVMLTLSIKKHEAVQVFKNY